MATSRATPRQPLSGSARVSTFELLFDLVFVFAFTQVTEFMVSTHSAVGVLQALIILSTLWWSWSSYGWLTNQTSVNDGILRIGMLVAMCGIFVQALAIPSAFHRSGSLNAALVIGIAYLVVRLVHMGLYLVAAGDDRALRRQVLRSSVSMWVSFPLIVVGALITPAIQTWFWLAAVVADIALTYLTARGGDWRIHSAAHWAERHGLVIILALGESVVAIGAGVGGSRLTLAVLGGAVLALLLTAGLWWLYFDAISSAAEERLSREDDRGRAALATDAYTFVHLLLVSGIVISALGVEEVMRSVDKSGPLGLFGSCALYGGTALYLFGHAVFWKRAGGTWKVWRLVGASLLLASIPLGLVVSSIVALGLAVLLTALVIVIESLLFSADKGRARAATPR
jgi:low temperature requirement protein LtrA